MVLSTLLGDTNIDNSGLAAAGNVTLAGILPAGASFVSASHSQGSCSESAGSLSCLFGLLASSASASVTLQLQAPSSPGKISLSASVSADEQDPDTSNNLAQEQTQVEAPPPMADLSLGLSDSPDPVVTSGVLTYSMTVTNGGPDLTSNVVLSGSLPTGTAFRSATPSQGSCSEAGGSLSCTLGTLAGSASISLEVRAPATPGTIVFSAAVSADEQDQDPSNNSATEQTEVEAPPVAGLSVALSDSPDPVLVNGLLTYTITVANDGPDAAANTALTGNLPGGAAFLSAVPSQGSCSEAGASKQTSIQLIPTNGTEVTGDFSVTAFQTDPEMSNNRTLVTVPILSLQSDLAITKTASASQVEPGEEFSYRLVVENLGPADAQQVTIRDQLPQALLFVAATPEQGSCGQSQGLVECELGSLQAGRQTQVEIVVRALTEGAVSNLAVVESSTPDPMPCNNQSRADADVQQFAILSASLADGLVDDADSNGIPSPGDVLRLRATIFNTGSAAAEGVVFVLFPDPSAAVIAGSVHAGFGRVGIGNRSGDASVRVEGGRIEPQSEANVELDLLIQQGHESGIGYLSHQGMVSSVDRPAVLTGDPDTPSLYDSTLTVLTDSSYLSATLTPIAGSGNLMEASVTNLGRRTATGIILVREGAAQNQAMPNLAPGKSWTRQFSMPFQAEGPWIVERHTQAVFLSNDQPASLSSDRSLAAPETPTRTAVGDNPLLYAELGAYLWRDADRNGRASEGDTILYLARILNRSSQLVRRVTIQERPDTLSLLQAGSVRTSMGRIVSGSRQGDQDVEIEIDTLAPGEVASFSYQRILPVPLPNFQDDLESRLLVQAQSGFPILSRSADGAEPTRLALGSQPRIEWQAESVLLDDRNSDGLTSAGDQVLILLRILNRGAADAEQLQLSVTPGEGLRMVEDSLRAGPGAETAEQEGAAAVMLRRLGRGKSLPVSLAVDIDETLPPGAAFLSTAAEVSSVGAASTQFTVATPLASSLDVRLSQIAIPEDPQPGEKVKLYLRLDNEGPATATQVQLSSQLSSQILQAANASFPCEQTAAGVSCQVAALPAGGRADLELTLHAEESETVFSTASASAAEADFQMINSESTLEVDVRAFELLFPFLLSGTDDFTGFALSNPSSVEAVLEIEGRAADGTLLQAASNPASEDLMPGSQLARLARELLSLPQAEEASSGWLRIRSDRGPLGSFFQFGNGLRGELTQLDGSVAQQRSSKVLLFTRIFQGLTRFPDPGAGTRQARTWLCIANPHTQDVVLYLQLYDPQGMSLGESLIRELAGGGVIHETVESLFGLENVSGGHVRVDVGGPGAVGFALLELDDAVLGLNAVTPALHSRLYSAQLAGGPDVFTSLKLVNSSQSPRSVRLLARVEDGGLLSEPFEFEFEPRESLEISISELFGLGEAAVVGSLEIEADGPGVVGDVVFGDPVQAAFAAALPLQTETFRQAVFSHVANTASQAPDRSKAAFTGLAFYNPLATPADLTISVFQADGTAVGSVQRNMAPLSRFSRLLTELIPESAGLAGGFVLVQADAGLVAQELFGNLDLTFLSAVPPMVLESGGTEATQCFSDSEPR